VIITTIILGSIKLAASTFINDKQRQEEGNIHYTLYNLSESVDILFNIIYFLEFMIKSITMGLVLDKNSYLTVSWNKLDFIIVIASFQEYVV
jgi:hypothetical protein